MLKIQKLKQISRAKNGSRILKGMNGLDFDTIFKYTKNYTGTKNNLANIGKIADTGRNLLFSNQDDSNLTKGIDSAYNAIADSAMMFSPVGTIIGGAMKLNAFVGDGLQALGGGTDQVTVVDLILDSPLFATNIGAINGFLGKKTRNFDVNEETIEEIGSSYGGTVDEIYKAKSLAGKKYGAFSSKARRKANRAINAADTKQMRMTNIANEQENLEAIRDSTMQLNAIDYNIDLNGGIQQQYLRAAKQGAKLSSKIDLLKSRKNLYKEYISPDKKIILTSIKKYIPEEESNIDYFTIKFKEGGQIKKEFPLEYLIFLQDVSKYAPNLSNPNPETYNMFRYWLLNGEPTSFYEAMKKEIPMFSLEKDGYHARTIAWNEDGEGEWMKSPEHESYKNEELWFDKGVILDENGNEIPLEGKDKEEWEDFKKKYYIEVRNNKTTYKPKFEDGGKIRTLELEETTLKNVIPEGALHKNKHYMEDSEGLTKKGIPVVDNENELQAEIERDEIIFRLEVTKKLEELNERYQDENITQKEKDSLAIEAGKLLVLEILYNTDDRTNLIEKVIENEIN